MEKESTLALIKALEADVKTCLEKDLDTNEELKKKKEFTNNFTAMLDFLVKLKAPSGIQAEIKDILKLIGDWDVYAYWFKEMKDLVAKVKKFISDFKSFAEDTGLLPKAQKPVEAAPAALQERPGLAPPAKPSTPTLLKPMVLGASPQKPTPPSMPALPSVAKISAGAGAAPASSSESKERTVPLLKPVFKLPAVKQPAASTAVTPPAPAHRSAAAPAIDASSAPVPLKTLVDEKKLEIHVKPVKLIKPILAVQAPSPVAEEPPEKPEPPAKLAVPVVSAKEAVPAAKPVARVPLKPTGAEKPLLIPKPIKILVPDLDNINLGDEVADDAQGVEPPAAQPPETPGEDGLFSEMGVIEGSIPVKAHKAPPARVVKPIPVKIQLGKAAVADPNDEIVESVVERVYKRMDPKNAQAQKAPAPVQKATVDEDEYITPMEVSPEELDGWGADEDPNLVPLPSPAKPSAAKKNVVEMLDAAESWDDDQISSILDEAMDDGTSNSSPGAVKKGQAAGPITFKRAAKPTPAPEEQEGDGGDSIGIIEQEPKKTRLQEIKKAEPVTEPEPVNSMSLFMGGLGSKRGDRKASPSTSGLSLFRPGGMADASASAAPEASTTKATAKKQQPAAPLGSDVDIEALPDTKDGLYQALIALEGKRYAIERARKDLRTDLDRGIIKQPAYEQKLADLKAEMDKIADKIKEIREKIKKFK